MVYPALHSPHTIQNSLFAIKSRLAPHTSTPSLDAQVLLAHITGQSRAWLLAHPEVPLTSAQNAQLELSLQQLESGLPLPYLLGEWEFFGLKFKVTPDVLIPRPETELLVETALEWLKTHQQPETTSLNGRLMQTKGAVYAADIGTGSGCIAISLAVHCPKLHLLATDLSPAALAIARHNAKTHGVSDRISFLQADLLNNLQSPIPNISTRLSTKLQFPISKLQLLLANLPYIPTATLHTLQVCEREPTLALDGGPDGLSLISRLLAQAATSLAPGGLMLLEIEATQGDAVLALARHYFPNALLHLKADLAGHDRLLSIQTSQVS
ncbi:MAG: peptide chain release factor N(5)-glutamine methyltransferase [Anaerolineales bacterium]